MGQHDAVGAGPSRVVARLCRGQVAPVAGPLGPRQGRFDEQEVGVARDLDELLAGTAVGAVGEPAGAVLGAEVDRVRGGEVRHLLESGPQGSNLHRGFRVVLLDRKGVCDQVLAAPRARQPAEALGGARGRNQPGAGGIVGPGVSADRDGLLARRVGERIRVRNEVEDVIGVEVRDEDRVDVDVVDVLAELREDAVAAIEQELGLAVGDQVPAACAPGVLPRRGLPQHGDPHRNQL